MKVFEAILDDGRDVFKVYKACSEPSEMEKFCLGNGEIVRIKDVTETFGLFTEEGVHFLADTLINANYGQAEIDIITRLVADIY